MASARQFASSRSRVAASFANPCGTPDFRITVPGDSSPTCTALLHNVSTYDLSTVKGTYSDVVPIGSMPLTLFRDPFRSVVKLIPNVAGTAMSYTTMNTVAVEAAGFHYPAWPFLKSNGSFSPHGTHLFFGRCAEEGRLRFVWCDRHTKLVLTSTTYNASDLVSVYKLVDSDTLDHIETLASVSIDTGASETFTFTPSSEGYYALSLNLAAKVVGRVVTSLVLSSVSGGDFGDCFGHLATPQIENHLSVMRKSRVNAASVLISPVANVLNRNGIIHGIVHTSTVEWITKIQTEDINLLPGVEDLTFGRRQYEKGMYAYLKPGGLSELSWKYEVSDSANGGLFDVSYPLDSNENTVSVVVTCSKATDTATPSAIVELTVFHSMEWVPVADQWNETHLAPTGGLDLLLAIDELRLLPVFFDNPIHLKAIKEGLARAARFVGAGRHGFAAILSSLFPALSPVFKGIATAGDVVNWN